MKMNFKNKIFHQVYDKSFYRDGKRKRWEEKRSRKINRHFVNPILLLPKITLESITIRKHIFYDIRNDFFSVWYCTVSNHLLCNRLMIRIVASSRHGVPNISLQVSFVSMKFQNFDRRSFHVDTTNFVTYDPTSLDLGGRLLKRKKITYLFELSLRFPWRHDTAGRWTWHVSCRSFCIPRRMWKRRM